MITYKRPAREKEMSEQRVRLGKRGILVRVGSFPLARSPLRPKAFITIPIDNLVASAHSKLVDEQVVTVGDIFKITHCLRLIQKDQGEQVIVSGIV